MEMSFLEGDNVFGHENLIWIRHEDGTVARYYHLAHSSARVANGDAVDQGQVIASSDNTGNSTGPHLHFDVVQCLTGLTPADINTLPCGQSLPLSFKNTHIHKCGLEVGKDYPALPY
jgi:murein DD-endopeptidase MepM/ murein hydrolase activator NlpD